MVDLSRIATDDSVLCPDAPLGRVDAVVTSPRTGAVARLVVELAGQPRRYVLIPPEWVCRVGDGLVWLDRERGRAIEPPLRRRNAEGFLQPTVDPPLPLEAVIADDAALEAEARRALAADPLTRDGAIAVSVAHGVATLTGYARTAAGAFQARKLALAVSGIWHARHDLHHDEAIVVEIKRQLLLEAIAAEVDSDLGHVTITAADPAALARAEAIARSVPGVRSVGNR